MKWNWQVIAWTEMKGEWNKVGERDEGPSLEGLVLPHQHGKCQRNGKTEKTGGQRGKFPWFATGGLLISRYKNILIVLT